MPNIKPVSDLRNYGEVLRDVAVGQPVFLTKNGHGRYAVLDMEEYRQYEKLMAMQKLMTELEKGRRSGKEQRYCSLEDAEKELRIHDSGSHGRSDSLWQERLPAPPVWCGIDGRIGI